MSRELQHPQSFSRGKKKGKAKKGNRRWPDAVGRLAVPETAAGSSRPHFGASCCSVCMQGPRGCTSFVYKLRVLCVGVLLL